MHAKTPFFTAFPTLEKTLPHVHLGDWPTPVRRLKTFGDALHLSRLYIKCDDVSGPLYGGNKIRKLEFLLGKALTDNRKSVLTFGAAGSNHALATALYARQLGLHSIVHLFPQPASDKLRQTLRRHLQNDTEMHAYTHYNTMTPCTLWRQLAETMKRGSAPMVIPGGGTTPLGACGFVAAAFELKAQVEQGLCPEPDIIVLPLGTMGTATGLAVGLKAAGLNTRIHAVRVVPQFMANMESFKRLYDAIAAFLVERDPAFPCVQLAGEVCIDDAQFGGGYAEPTPEGEQAVKQLAETESIALETTYTGKALAALVQHAPNFIDKTVLFWNTFNSQPQPKGLDEVDAHDLPRKLRRYFR